MSMTARETPNGALIAMAEVNARSVTTELLETWLASPVERIVAIAQAELDRRAMEKWRLVQVIL